MSKRVVIIHGWGGRPDEGWRPWLSRELNARGYAVTMPQMPNSGSPVEREWVQAIAEAVGTPDEGVILVGHSLGCMAILRYLGSLHSGRVGAVVFVAGFVTSLGIPEIENFFTAPVDFTSLKARSSSFAAIYSDDDPYVPPVQAQLIRKGLGAKTILAKGMGHFSHSDGCSELPAVLDAIADAQFPPK